MFYNIIYLLICSLYDTNTSIGEHLTDKLTNQHDSGKTLHITTQELCEFLQESFIELPMRFLSYF